MRLGFVDCLDSTIDAFDLIGKLAEQQADVQLVRSVSPDALKIPVAAKKLFAEEYVDAVLAFAQVPSDDKTALDILLDKTIDVELAHSKFVFLCLVFNEEWRSQDQLGKLAHDRLVQSLDLILAVHREQYALKPQTPPATGGGMDMFSVPGESAQADDSEKEAHDLLGDEHTLF